MISRNEGAKLVALIDKRKNILGIDEYEGVPFFYSLEEFLQAGIDTDVINIASPNGFHAQQGMRVLDSGYHLVIEKPIALT